MTASYSFAEKSFIVRVRFCSAYTNVHITPRLGLNGQAVDSLHSHAYKSFPLSLYLHALTSFPRAPSCLYPHYATLHSYARHLERRVCRPVEAMEKVQDNSAATYGISGAGSRKWASWPFRSANWRRMTWVNTFTHRTDKVELLSRGLASMTCCPWQGTCFTWMNIH